MFQSSIIRLRRRLAPTKAGLARRIVSLLSLTLVLVACGNSDDSAPAAEESGELFIGLTDAPGDFVHYTVDVTQITLTKLNDAVVTVLPVGSRVDFAEYTDMTEFLTAARVPAGVYKKAELSLDFTHADIWVEAANGAVVKVQDIVDEAGTTLTQTQVAVHLEGRHRLLIVAGVPAHISLDFDLQASNQVEFDSTGQVPVLTVSPLLLADVELTRPKIHRVRGPLVRVNVANNSFKVILRPFNLPPLDDRRLGELLVKVDDATVYEINESGYTGAAGLAALDALPALAAVVAIGDLRPNPRRFVAREVYAGSSVPGGDRDVVTGVVIARSGDELNVRGATLIRAGGSVEVSATILVRLASTTRVKQQGSASLLNSQAISVGQRLTVFGTLNADATSLDASDGFARMLVTNLRGTRVAAVGVPENPPPLVMDLQRIQGRPVTLFDFSGTGSEPANDADPQVYEIDTADLNLASIADNSPVWVKGFVRPFGAAPMDFNALSVTDLSGVDASLALNWAAPNREPYTRDTSSSVQLNLSGVAQFHHFGQGGVLLDMLDLSTAPRLIARDTGDGVFVLIENGGRHIYLRFADFIEAIDLFVTQGQGVKAMKCAGPFHQGRAEMELQQAVATLNFALR